MARLVDITRCTACRGCQVACKSWNQLEGEIGEFTGSFQSHADNSPGRWTMIKFYEQKKSTGLEWHFRKHCCLHCGDPGCMKACPNDAIRKAENGAVIRVEENCVGCEYCVPHCPFGIPKVDPKTEKMQKCSFCFDRISNGLQPACSRTCVSAAIVYGTWEEMAELAEVRLENAKKLYPNAMIYGKENLDGLGVIYILPDSPDQFELPINPTLSPMLGLWKDMVQPLGNLVLGGTLAATGLAFLFTRRKVFGLEESAKLDEGGYYDEQTKNDKAL